MAGDRLDKQGLTTLLQRIRGAIENRASKEDITEAVKDKFKVFPAQTGTVEAPNDLDGIRETGIYPALGVNTNAPDTGVGVARDFWIFMAVHNDTTATQVAIAMDGPYVYIRQIISGTWQTWQRMTNYGDVYNVVNVRACNPNILDNWYFPNPVNQRGLTEYANGDTRSWIWTIDRWKSNVTLNQKLTWNEKGLKIYGDDSIEQCIENCNIDRNSYYTFSVLFADNTFWNLTFKPPAFGADPANIRINRPKDTYITSQINFDVSDYDQVTPQSLRVRMWRSAYDDPTTLPEITAVKLEKGFSQTLCHDEEGIWKVNEIPNYAEQLARCQRYQLQVVSPKDTKYSIVGVGVALTDTSADVYVATPVPLARRPAIISNTTLVLVNANNSWATDAIAATNLTLIRVMNTGVAIRVTVASGLTVKGAYLLCSNTNNSSVLINANVE